MSTSMSMSKKTGLPCVTQSCDAGPPMDDLYTQIMKVLYVNQ